MLAREKLRFRKQNQQQQQNCEMDECGNNIIGSDFQALVLYEKKKHTRSVECDIKWLVYNSASMSMLSQTLK